MSEMYIKCNTNVLWKYNTTVYKKYNFPEKDSLTDNNYLRATVMIQRSTTRFQHILYPTKVIRPELPNRSTSKL